MKWLRGKEGFTYVELMIALAVMILAVVGYVGANMAVQQASEGQFEKSVAVQDVNQVIEQMRDLSSVGQFPGNVTVVYPNGGAVNGFNNLTNEQIAVTYADAAANPLDVTVTVTWDENGRRTVNLGMRTLITQRITT